MLLPARYFLYTLFFIATMLMVAVGQVLYIKGDQIQLYVQQEAQEHAKKELEIAINNTLELVDSELQTMANWDEIHQQISQPSYYYYWKTQRLNSSEFFKPYYLELELYDPTRKKLMAANNEAYQVLPAELHYHKKYLQVQLNRKELLIVSQPIVSRTNPEQIDGYISVAIDFFKLLETQTRFDYLDFKKLFFNQTGIIKEQDILQTLTFQTVSMPVNQRLWHLISQFVFGFTLAGILIGMFVLLATGLILIWPLHQLAKFLQTLLETKEPLVSKPKYLVKEFHGLHNQLTEYHNQLLSSQTKLVEKNQQMWSLLRQDSLTGLANVRALQEFWQIITEEISEHPFTVSYLIFDCDQFATFGKKYSHEIGEQIIIESGKILQKVFASTSVYRTGIDQFVVILTDTSPKHIEQLGKKSLRQIAAFPFERLGVFEKVSYSLGISHMEAEESRNHMEALPKQARMALFKAKQQVVNKLEFYSSSNLPNLANKPLQTLNKVLDSVFNPENLSIYFQPVVNAQKQILHYECLVRILDEEVKQTAEANNDENSLILPATICDLVRHHGLEEEFDRSVLQKIAKILPELDLRNTKGLSINLSPKTLLQDYLVDLLEPFLTYLNQIQIIIEVQESIVTNNPELFTLNLNKLRRQGFLVAIDKFGKESTNLFSLPKLPVDFIKLDSKILQLIETDEINRLFISNFLQMLLQTPAKTVLVGLETQQQLEFLQQTLQQDFDKVLLQGFWFGKPQPGLVEGGL